LPLDPIFLGDDPFIASVQPQIRYEIEGSRTIIEIFALLGSPPFPITPGAPTAEIELVGEFQLTAEDIILA
jgi:hypothetical protein